MWLGSWGASEQAREGEETKRNEMVRGAARQRHAADVAGSPASNCLPSGPRSEINGPDGPPMQTDGIQRPRSPRGQRAPFLHGIYFFFLFVILSTFRTVGGEDDR